MTIPISPLDGRYADKLSTYPFLRGEYALTQERVRVECAWLVALADCPQFGALQLDSNERQFIDALVSEFAEPEFAQIKAIEQECRHDVKAVEYYLARRCAQHPGLTKKRQFIHFACTSEDINNLAYAGLVAQARAELVAQLGTISTMLKQQAETDAELPMLARTHGQSATPTTLGKELANFAHRLSKQSGLIAKLPIEAKCNGATGNYNAHAFACPQVDWLDLSRSLVERLGFSFNAYSTQIEPHDYLANLFSSIANANSILLDLTRDLWAYISMGYYRQSRKSQAEVGSSTMPHKINPIDFENAEGNLGLANALLLHMSTKLPISRLQRDLSDSTVLRNIMPACAYCLLAYQSMQSGLGKITADKARIAQDLDQQWALLAEPIQTVMRLHGINDAYEQLKQLTRGQAVSKQLLHEFIEQLPIDQQQRQRLRQLTPGSYLGYAAQLARQQAT